MEKEPYTPVEAKVLLEINPQIEKETQQLFEWICQKAQEDGCEVIADKK